MAWHRRYEREPGLVRRLETVRELIRRELAARPAGPIRAISLCAGDGRDLLEVLASHPRGPDVTARLVDADPTLVAAGRERIARSGFGGVEFQLADARAPDAVEGAVPADLVVACGIFGNIADDDLHHFVDRLPELCAPGAAVVWTRGRFEPDLTPTIRGWFRAAGFDEIAFVAIPNSTMSAGAHRFTGSPRNLDLRGRLFTFLPEAERPSRRTPRAPG